MYWRHRLAISKARGGLRFVGRQCSLASFSVLLQAVLHKQQVGLHGKAERVGHQLALGIDRHFPGLRRYGTSNGQHLNGRMGCQQHIDGIQLLHGVERQPQAADLYILMSLRHIPIIDTYTHRG